MSSERASPVERAYHELRLPEYTGENRCLPCTVTNLCIAAAGTVAIGLVSLPAAGAFLLVSLASIWLRGYLVPGTPELTKRYFPDWLLAKFDKHEPAHEQAAEVAAPGEPIDTEAVLLEAGVVEPCRGDDLCLDSSFEAAWRDRMTAVRDEERRREVLAEQLDIDPASLSVERYGDASVVKNDGRRVGQWESNAALLADLGAAALLPQWVDQWGELTATDRSELLNGLRVFAERCPDCDGPVAMQAETTESCCRSHEVIETACQDCGARLLEVPADAAA